MKKLPSVYPLVELSGSPRACGRQYGESQAEMIDSFLHMEVAPDAKRLRYAAACWEHLAVWDKCVAEFVRGMAKGAGRSVEELTLILLHEEIAHTKHCTAIGATGEATRGGEPIVGENWDWSSRLYPWSSLVRLRSDSGPAAVHYAFPGLWACAGINEHGLSLVWTGAGSIPDARPRVGVPTYALIAGVLACRGVADAVALIERTRTAGFFIFFLADAGGEVRVVEGWPGRCEVARCDGVITRANHYECAAPARATKMRIARERPEVNTHSRAERMAALGKRHRGKIDPAKVEAFLADLGVADGQTICQVPRGERRTMTLDSLYCLPKRRELRIARGLPTRHEFATYRV